MKNAGRAIRLLASIASVFLILSSVSIAATGTVVSGAIGCTTEDALDEMITAAVNKDYQQMQVLISNGQCADVGDLPYSAVDPGFATSKIRVYFNDGSTAVVFVPAEFAR